MRHHPSFPRCRSSRQELRVINPRSTEDEAVDVAAGDMDLEAKWKHVLMNACKQELFGVMGLSSLCYNSTERVECIHSRGNSGIIWVPRRSHTWRALVVGVFRLQMGSASNWRVL